MVGLDAAGKTTILYKLKLGEIVTTIPTIGMFSKAQLKIDKEVSDMYYISNRCGVFSVRDVHTKCFAFRVQC